MKPNWEAAAAKKRDELNALIPPDWKIDVPPKEQLRNITDGFIQSKLTDEEVKITETDAFGIAENIKSRQWTAVKVVKAFNHRAALAHQLTNCLLEIFFEAGVKRAQELDEYQASTGNTIGPLHGVPVSLKDQFHVKGVETTMGYVGWIGTFQGEKGTGKERVFESELTKELYATGAVFYCKTSVPHSLMCGETFNNIVKYCMNPRNRLLSSGGSSGGEGALIGARGSPVGLGTDIGGSIRIPSAFNGLFGIRPSTGRLPYEGLANSMDGQISVASVVGPLATTARSLKLVFQAILSQEPWFHDPYVHEIPWRHEMEQETMRLAKSKGLSFGIMHHDGVAQPHPPVQRAMRMVEGKLRELGHEVVAWDPKAHEDLLNNVLDTWRYDAGTDINKDFALSGETTYAGIMEPGFGNKTQFDAMQISKVNRELRQSRKTFIEQWNGTAQRTSTKRPIDAIISPAAPYAAVRPNLYKHINYTAVMNAADMSCVIIPVTIADQEIDAVNTDFKPLSEFDRTVQEDYDAEITHGAPVSIQLIGRRLQEEKVIALAEYIGKALGTTI